MASATGTTGRASKVKAGNIEQNLCTSSGSSHSINIYGPQSPTRMTNERILKLAGAFHVLHSVNVLFHPGPSSGPRGERGYTPKGIHESSDVAMNSRVILKRPRVQTSGIPPFAKSAKVGAPERHVLGREETRSLLVRVQGWVQTVCAGRGVESAFLLGARRPQILHNTA
jgi:hypothetical protein